MRATGSLAVLALAAGAVAQPPEAPLPPRDRAPQLVVRHPGPHAPVVALAFGPDNTLYAGGFGKAVYRYTADGGKFAPAEPLRVPLGPGTAGVVNAVAVAPDGKWVAVAGRAPVRGETWAGADDGVTVEVRSFPPLLKRDHGVVYLFDPADPRGGKVVRGAEAAVRALAFATPAPAAGPALVTAEWDREGAKPGTVRVFDVKTGTELTRREDLPPTPTRPGLAAWADAKGLKVAVAWPPADAARPGDLLVWDTAAKTDQRFPDGLRTVALALRTGAKNELISGAVVAPNWGIVTRPADAPGAGKTAALTGQRGEFFLPLAVAPVGAGTAALVQILPHPDKTPGRVAELRYVGPDGTTTGRMTLKGVANDPNALPALAASPDGKWVAVAGFADHRIEVYDAAALARNERVVQVLGGEPGGYARVAFLAGNRLWLGGSGDEAPRGGVVFDPVARKAGPPDPGAALDAPPAHPPLDPVFHAESATLTVKAGGRAVKLALRPDEIPTAVALLPAAPAWDKALGPVVAVAHHHRTAAVALVTLFDATDGRKLMHLGGPTLRVEWLAFSGSRPLLAAVGPDRTVAVWSLKGLAAPFAAVEGITLAERDGKLAVASVAADSPARAALKAGDIIEAVGGEKGEPRGVATYREFVAAVRALPVGGTARLRVNGAVAAVPVGRGVGHRRPLFEVWVNPAANAGGGRDWIAWTPAGPYDADSPAAEARLGWLTATGDPAEPTTLAGADQYRRLYYKPNFFRFLADAADFPTALGEYTASFPRTPPALAVRAEGAETRDGVQLLRAKPDGLEVRLDDPDGVLRLDDAVLRWRAGPADEWKALPFRDGAVTLPLAGHAWTRGAHRFEFEVRELADLPPAVTAAAAFRYVPAAPTVAARVNGAAVAPGAAPVSAKPEIDLAADVAAAPGEDVVVTATAGGRTVPLPAGKGGRFGPVALKLDPEAKTTIRLTARNAAATDPLETTTTDLTIWHAPPAPRPVPRVTLAVASPVDAPSAPGRPFVSDGPKVRLAATISAEGMTAIEWDDGDEKWAPGELPKAGEPATREVVFTTGGVPRSLRVRVTAGGVARADAVSVVWAALPNPDFIRPADTVRSPALRVTGPTQPAPGGGPFAARVVVESIGSAAPAREFPVGAGEGGNWKSAVELAPGANRLALVVKNEWKEVRCAECEVRYVRPPVVAGVAPVAARAGDVGDVLAAVVAPAELPPARLTLDGRPLDARPAGPPLEVFGVGVWWLKADAVPLAAAGAVPKAVRVAAVNADGAGDELEVTVIPKKEEPPPPPPPVVVVTAGPEVIAPGANLQTDEPEFALGLRVTSTAKLTEVTIRFVEALPGQPDRVPGVSAEKAVEAPGGFELAAAPTVALREGVNAFEVTAANGGSPTVVRFSVSYTPPPVRVLIDEVAELKDNVFRPLPRPAGAAVKADGGRLRVRGRVVFRSPAEAARGAGYEVVLFANDARHLPVAVARPKAGETEAVFESPLFLNAAATTVRVEVARRNAADPAPQVLTGTRLAVEASGELPRQRLHVVVVAPEEPRDRGGAMAREVVRALNGTIEGGEKGFTNGPFTHRAFARATLYRPLVGAVDRAEIVGQLHEVEAGIRRAAAEPGPTGYVNDVVILYYQGRDLMGRDGVRRLHTTRSLGIANPATAEAHAVRLDELPVTSGVRFAVLSVVTDDGKEPPQRVTSGPMLLRYAWQSRESFPELLEFYRVSIGQNRTVGTVVDWVRREIEKQEARRRHGAPTETLTPTVRERPIGAGGQRP